MTWSRALRSLTLAVVLVLAVAFVAGNFVEVDVRLWGLDVRTRLALVATVPAALGFAGGLLYARSRARRR